MEKFIFNEKNANLAKQILTKYPHARKKSAILPLLHLAQKQNGGWLSTPALEHVGDYLDLPYVKVYEVASFYSMFNLKPVGKYHIQVCGTTPCMLCGSKEIVSTLERTLDISMGQVSDDGMFSLTEVECVGGCIKAPVIQINDEQYENITPAQVEKIIQKLKK